jgi:hypothetical protein
MEPHRLRRWKRTHSPNPLPFFTCARPGRSAGKSDPVPDSLVDKWVKGLPGDAQTAIVSLLGTKPDGTSEFSFYSFGGKEEARSRPSFQQWLDRRHPARVMRVFEHPTVDFKPIPTETLAAAAADIESLLASEWTVIVIDSGGESRTKALCKHLNLVEDSRKV